MPESVSTETAAPRLALGELSTAYAEAVERARVEDWVNRLFSRDPSLWSSDPTVQATIRDRLGWLDAPAQFTERIPSLEGFGDGVVDEGFTAAVVAGMGGSSLAPDILHRTFGSQEGYLELRILDSTDPAFVAATLDDLDPVRTLVIIASKSGTTTEPLAFLADAWARAKARLDGIEGHAYEALGPGAFFVAITDPGASLEAIPHHDRFREVFRNPPDIGGRYSALTFVGLVPASLIGLDLDALLASASTMAGACRQPDPAINPGVSLGTRDRDAGQERPRQAHVPHRRRHRGLRRMGRAADRREHGEARRRDRADRPRAARRRRVLRLGSRLRPDLAARQRRRRTGGARRRARGGRPPGHPHRDRRPDRHRRGGLALGDRHGRSPARSWASTRSTSPTSRRRNSSRGGSSSKRTTARPRRRRPPWPKPTD